MYRFLIHKIKKFFTTDNRGFLDAYPIEHMQLAWNKTKQPLVVINTQMAEFEIADISCTSENVTYKAGRFRSGILSYKTLLYLIISFS